MKFTQRRIGVLLAVVLAVSVTFYALYSIVVNPGKIVHELGGDGIKNYFSYLYHASYGNGLWFDGMNYPYGEHIMYVDGQPLLSVTLSYLRNWVTLTPEMITAILNLLMAFTFVLAILYVYKILLKFNVPIAWALLFSVLIVAMSLQNFRIYGLYGLSYTCIIPMTFYWFVNYHETGRRKYMYYTFILACAAMLLHPYQLAHILVWSFFYCLAYWFITSDKRNVKLKHVAPLFMMMVAAVVIFKLITFLSDPITDRPVYPHGLLSYCTTGQDIFTSPNSPYWSYLKDNGVVNTLGDDAKSYAYTGIVAIVVLCVMVVLFLYKRIRKQAVTLQNVVAGFSPVWIVLALLALLFSMGVPFVWGMEWMFDYVASFRQFRMMGWFGQLFYYITTVFAVVVLHGFYKQNKARGKTALAMLFVLLPACLWTFEAYGVVQKLRDRANLVTFNYNYFYSKEEQGWKNFLSEHNYAPSDFQAILHMPYYHNGSEKLWLAKSAWGVSVAMKAAFQLQLPLVDANMSRSSWSQTFKQVKIGGGPFTYKSLLHEVADNRPYLLVRFEEEELNPDEQYLFDNADSIGVASNMIAYAMYPERIRKSDESAVEWIKQVSDSMLSSDTLLGAGNYYYHHFDTDKNKEVFFGHGAAQSVIGKDTIIASIDVSGWEKNNSYESSAWFLVNSTNYKFPKLHMKISDQSGAVINVYEMLPATATDNLGFWFRASLYFTLPEHGVTIQYELRERKEDVYYGMDELLIWQVGDTVISKDKKGSILVNNHLLR